MVGKHGETTATLDIVPRLEEDPKNEGDNKETNDACLKSSQQTCRAHSSHTRLLFCDHGARIFAVMPPRPKTVPPTSKSSLITSFFSRIDQPRERFSAVRPSVRALAAERAHAVLLLDRRRAVATIGSTSRVPPPASYDSMPVSSNNDRTVNNFLQEMMEDQALDDDMPIASKEAINNDDNPSEPLAPVYQRDPVEDIDDEEEDDDEARNKSEPHDRNSLTLNGIDHTTSRAAGTSVRKNRYEPEEEWLREIDNLSKRQRTFGASTSTFSTADPAQRIISKKNLFRSSRNIVHQLASRSFIGSSRHHFSSLIRCDTPMCHYRHWKIASKLRIPVKTATASNGMNATNVLAFDRDGSLLAVAQGRAEVAVYDWQSMRLTTRRRTKVGGNSSSDLAECQPMLQFKVGPFSVPIALLAWNPFNEDEIVIGLR
jgi:hypothetical protein